MRSALLLLLVGLGVGCGSNVSATGVELVVAPGRRAPRLDAHPAIDRARAAARAVCGREVPIRFELLGIRPESFAAERAVEELEGIASALERLASRPTSEPLREHVRENLDAIVVTHVFPPPRTREVHFGIEPSPHDSRERSPNDRGVLRVFWAPAPQHPARPTNGETDVLLELGRAHSIARARRFASVEPEQVPRDAFTSYAAYLGDVGSHGLWSLERRAPQRRRPSGWRRDLLLRALRAHDTLDDGPMPLDDRTTLAALEHVIFSLVEDRESAPPELTQLVRTQWVSLDDSVRFRVLVQVASTLPAPDSTPRAPYGISLEDWMPRLLQRIRTDPLTADEMLCASNEPTCTRDRLARFVAHHPRIGPSIVRGLASTPTLLARFFGSALVVPRSSPRPPLPWAELARALDHDAQLVAARALADASRTTGQAPHELEAGVAAIYPEAGPEVRAELLRLLAQHTRPSDGEPSAIRAEAAELALALRHPHGGLDVLGRALHFAADDVDLIAVVGPELETFLRGQEDEEEAMAWFRVMDAAVRRFGLPGAKAFADFLRARPHAAERELVVRRWLATLSRL